MRAKNFEYLCKKLKGYITPVQDSEITCLIAALFLSSEKKGLKQAFLKEANKSGILIFGNYPLEHWEIGQFFNSSINLINYPGTEYYLERYLGVFSIAYPNDKKKWISCRKTLKKYWMICLQYYLMILESRYLISGGHSNPKT